MMYALSLWQPWASLMAWGEKRVETRSYPPPAGLLDHGPVDLAICSTKRSPAEAVELARTEPFRSVLAARLGLTQWPGPNLALDMLPAGKVVALVRLVGYYGTTEFKQIARRGTQNVGEHEEAFGNYAEGRFAWTTEGPPRVLAEAGAGGLLPIVGQRRIWTIPPRLEAVIRVSYTKEARP